MVVELGPVYVRDGWEGVGATRQTQTTYGGALLHLIPALLLILAWFDVQNQVNCEEMSR